MRRAGSAGGGGRWLRRAVALPVALKLGYDVGNLAPSLWSHYVEEEREKKTDVWNAVGDEVLDRLKSSAALRKQLGEAAVARMQVSDVISVSKSHLAWRFFTHHSPATEEDGKTTDGAASNGHQEKYQEWWHTISNFRTVMATEDLVLKVPLKSRQAKNNTAELSLLVNTHNDGSGWKVSHAWVETQDEKPVCVPLDRL